MIVLINDARMMETPCTHGMLLKNIDLLLELHWIGPIVITLTKRNELPLCRSQDDLGHTTTLLPKLIFRLKNRTDKVRVSINIFTNNFGRTIRGSIIMYDDLKWKVRSLHHEPVQRFTDV